ncbi:hypothetical protein ACJRO7_019632 [Eucalyptus globulus]|uniref:Uncharacterized protein n=1 Tax=Eucalyptus globulus TaxID=34317 RepID=A0ABD3KKJ6_EUCGL
MAEKAEGLRLYIGRGEGGRGGKGRGGSAARASSVKVTTRGARWGPREPPRGESDGRLEVGRACVPPPSGAALQLSALLLLLLLLCFVLASANLRRPAATWTGP